MEYLNLHLEKKRFTALEHVSDLKRKEFIKDDPHSGHPSSLHTENTIICIFNKIHSNQAASQVFHLDVLKHLQD